MPHARWTRILAIAGTTVLTLVVAILALLQLSPVATWVMRRLVPLVPLNPGYHLEVGRVSGDWIHHLTLHDVRLLEHDRELAQLDRLRVGYDLRRLRGRETRLDQLSLDGGRAVARREAGEWDLAGVLKSSAETSGTGGRVRVDRVELRDVQLALALSPDSVVRVRGLNLRARDLVIGDQILATIDQLNAGISPPGTTRWFALATEGAITAGEYRFDPVRIQTEETRIGGRVVVPRDLQDHRTLDRLDIRVRATPLAMEDLSAIVPAIAPEGDLRLDASATGDANGLVTARLGARLDEAALNLHVVAPISGSGVNYRVSGSMRRLDPARLYRAAPVGSLNGIIDAELRGPALDRSDGRVDLRLTPSQVAGTAVRRLDLRAGLYKGSADVALRGALEGGALAVRGRIRPFDSIPGYRLRGTARDLPGSVSIARTLSGDSAIAGLQVGFDVAGAGISPASARLRGNLILTGLSGGEDPSVASLPRDEESGELIPSAATDLPGTPLGHATLTLVNGRIDLKPRLLVGGGTVAAQVIVRLGDTLSYEVRNGTIDRVNLARLTADSAFGSLSARFTMRGRGTTPDQAVAAAQLHLDELRYGSQTLTDLTGRLQLRRRQTHLDIAGPLQGGKLRLQADARLFAETKTFQLRQALLERVDLGSLLGLPDLAGPVTLKASASGRVQGESRSVRGRITVSRSRVGGIEVEAGSAAVALTGDRLTYDGSLRTNGGSLALAGVGRPLATVPSFDIRAGRVDSLDLGTLLGRPGLQTGVNARFTARFSQDSAAQRQGRLSLQLLPSRVNGAQLDSGHVALNLNGSEVEGDVRLQGEDAELGAELNGRTGAATEVHTAGTLTLERLASWTGNPSADGRIESSFQLNAVTDSAGLRSLHGNVNAIGGIGGVRIHSAQIAMRPDSGGILVDTLFVRSNVAALNGRGRIALRRGEGSDTFRVTGVTYNVTPLAELVGDSISLDSARVAITLTGPAWRWRVASEARVNRMLAAGILAERTTLQATAALDSTRLAGLRGEVRVSGAALGKTRIPEARLTGRYDSLLTLDANVSVGDSARVIAELHGTVQSDTVQATLRRLDLVQRDSTWSLEQPVQLELKPRIAVDEFALRSGRHRLLVDGVYDPRHSSDITVRLTDVDLETLRSLGLVPIGGRVDGWVRLQGPAAAQTLEGRLGLGLRGRDGKSVGRIITALEMTPDEFRIDAAAIPLRGGRLTIDGTIPRRRTADTLALTVRADSFALGVLDPLLPPDAARDLRGTLLAQARVSGTLAAPKANGSLQIVGAGLTVPALDLSYRGELSGRLSGDELRIDRLQLRTEKKERLTAEGSVRLRPLTDPALDVTARLDQFHVSNTAKLDAIASGNVQLRGTLQRPSLTGHLTMGRTDITVGGGTTAGSVEDVELTPQDLRQVARVFGPAALAEAHQSPGLVDRFHLDLDLELPRRVWFRRTSSPRAEVELSGRVRLVQAPGQPMEFFGRVSPVPGRSTLDVYGREFRLTGGEIRLAGPTDSTMLDVTAEYQVPTQGGPEDEGVVISVAAKGHPDSLHLEFTGDPEMSQDDMLSYIVTGTPASDNPLSQRSAGGESAGAMGAQVALSGLTQSLSTTAERELGLDVFQIRQEGLRGLTLTAGRYVGSSVFLSMHLPIELGSDLQQTPGASLGPSFELEYVIQRWIRADIQGGSVPPRFTLRSRYAY